MEALTTTSLPSTRSLLNRGAGGGAAAGESWSRRTRSCRIRSRSAGGGRCRGETSSLPGSTPVLPGCRPRAIGGHPSVKCSFLSPLPISLSWGIIATDFEAAADCSWTFSACSGYGRRRSSRLLVPSSSFPSPMSAGDGSEEENDAADNGLELERAFGMDGTIPGNSEEFLRRVSSRAYSMRSHFMQTIGSSSYEVLERNPWREDSKLVFVLTHGNNQLCTMKTRQSRSEVERELGLLFSRRTKWDEKVDNMAKHSRSGNKFNMLVEDIREGVLVFEDESEASKYCELLQGGGQGCEGIAELEVSSVFDICQTMRALAVLFRRGRTPPLPKSLEQNLRARKRSLEDQDIV